jgi:radical SAM-linked protein
MATDPSHSESAARPAPAAAPPREKVRLRFRKGGDLRLVSHHDLMRCFERMLRRAGLPFHSTEGFNPKPRVVFASALPLGVVGCEEVVEIEFDAALTPEEVFDRLTRQAPAGLEILSGRRVERRTTAQVRRAGYRVAVPSERRAGLPERIAELFAAAECWVERTRPEPKRLDVRPYLHAVRLEDDGLHIELNVTPTGAARPDEILGLLDLHDLLDAGAVLERTRLWLHDEPTAGGTD